MMGEARGRIVRDGAGDGGDDGRGAVSGPRIVSRRWRGRGRIDGGGALSGPHPCPSVPHRRHISSTIVMVMMMCRIRVIVARRVRAAVRRRSVTAPGIVRAVTGRCGVRSPWCLRPSVRVVIGIGGLWRWVVRGMMARPSSAGIPIAAAASRARAGVIRVVMAHDPRAVPEISPLLVEAIPPVMLVTSMRLIPAPSSLISIMITQSWPLQCHPT